MKNLIDVKITSDDVSFIPFSDDGVNHEIVANLKVDPEIGNFKTNVITGKILLGHRVVATIDCGFSVQIPDGYKLKFSMVSHLARKGLVLVDTLTKDRVKVVICNIGHESIEIKQGDLIAKMEIEPVYKLRWQHEKG